MLVLFQMQYSVAHLTEMTISCAVASPAKHVNPLDVL